MAVKDNHYVLVKNQLTLKEGGVGRGEGIKITLHRK